LNKKALQKILIPFLVCSWSAYVSSGFVYQNTGSGGAMSGPAYISNIAAVGCGGCPVANQACTVTGPFSVTG